MQRYTCYTCTQQNILEKVDMLFKKMLLTKRLCLKQNYALVLLVVGLEAAKPSCVEPGFHN